MVLQLDRERAGRLNRSMMVAMYRCILLFTTLREEVETLLQAMEDFDHVEQHSWRVGQVRTAIRDTVDAHRAVRVYFDRVRLPVVPRQSDTTVGQRILLIGRLPPAARASRNQGVWDEGLERRAVVVRVAFRGVDYVADSGRPGFAGYEEFRRLYDEDVEDSVSE